MTRILTTAALVAALTAGAVSAAPFLFNGTPHFIKSAPSVNGTTVTGTVAAKVFVGSFAAWTVYRFFQNCGPFRC